MKLRQCLERAVTKRDYFHQPHPAQVDCADPSRSYYYDLRDRSFYPGPFQGVLPVVNYSGLSFAHPILAAQYGIGHLQRYWDTRDEALLAHAEKVAYELVATGAREQTRLVWRYPLLLQGQRNWLSAMAQGQVASLLLRVAVTTAQDALFDAARAALEVLQHNITEGGVQTHLDGLLWFEEYALASPPYTLNGFIVALFGLRDAGILLNDMALMAQYQAGVQTLVATLPQFDFNGWSRYDLSKRNMMGVNLANMASPF